MGNFMQTWKTKIRTMWNSGDYSLNARPDTLIHVNDVIRVKKFFWIPDKDFIGYTADAKHGHGLQDNPGSVDEGCYLKIIKISYPHAVVELERPEMPYGAPAPIGTLFKFPLREMHSWEKFKLVAWDYPCVGHNRYTGADVFFLKKSHGVKLNQIDLGVRDDYDMYAYEQLETPTKELALLVLKYGGNYGKED